MPGEHRFRAVPGDPDEQLLRQLENFGLTLEAAAGESLSPQPTTLEVPVSEAPTSRSHGPRPRRIFTVAAVVLVLMLAGAAIRTLTRSTSTVEIVPTVRPTEADGVGTDTEVMDGEVDGQEFEGQKFEGQEFGGETGDPALDDQRADGMEGPSVVLAADGTEIARFSRDAAGRAEVVLAPAADVGGADLDMYLAGVINQMASDEELLAQLGWPGESGGAELGDTELGDTDSGDTNGPSIEDWLASQGLEVLTPLDLELTAMAHDASDQVLSADAGYDTVVTTIELPSGRVQVHAATSPGVRQLVRPPGSSFKPIVLAEAFEQGYSPDDTIRADRPCSTLIDGETPAGNAGGWVEPQTLAAVTVTSNNCAYVRLGQVVGTGAVVDRSRELGIGSLGPDQRSNVLLPLGTEPVAIEELTAAYATFAADGIRITPRFIDRIVGADGTIVVQPGAPARPGRGQAVSAETARRVNQVLTSVVERGTGVRAQIDGHVVAGKTGTTAGFEDAWFVGYTPNLVTAVWLGDSDRPREVVLPGWGAVFGGEAPADIWQRYMTEALTGRAPALFTEPSPSTSDPKALELAPSIDPLPDR